MYTWQFCKEIHGIDMHFLVFKLRLLNQQVFKRKIISVKCVQPCMSMCLGWYFAHNYNLS